MPRIDSYAFSRVVIDGRVYKRDLIVYPDRVATDWWRLEAHVLHREDIEEVLESRPEVIIIGAGSPGLLSVPEPLRAEIASMGIELHVRPTAAAVELYGELCGAGRAVVAGLHLTC